METMDVVYRNVCGLDVHKKTVVACRRRVHSGGKIEKEVKSFGTTAAALQALLAWVGEWQISHVAMESTGVYWQPVWNVLEGHVELLRVNARHGKMVPGRKTDVKDCEWIAQLLQYGLLRASVVPSPAVCQWRDLTRHRTKLSDQHTAVVNRVHKTLEDANIKLGAVISDIMGVSGRRMLRAMAALGHERLKATPAALQASLVGNITAHHRFMLETLLDQVEFLEQQMTRLDEQIGAHLRVGGGLEAYLQQGFKGAVDPGQPEVQQMVEACLTPAHPDAFEPLLDAPCADTFDHATPQRQPQRFVRRIIAVIAVLIQIRIHLE